ncbi:RNA polymerase sigma-70 factor [Parabacteroides faecis]|uniref:RNA polymerase sigma-70 factor n=1 Tax=Parabacteroides faecis TaxID=1217282 RepID=UPI002164AC32|nr:RNA polymerase sigma-70 factor [Parabacteroides faecis]MCS2894155.1 RNA polymerase sigma-70 factor [Parabacteroides faecis]UVQ47260.1 RNA polymerase sigma-70 factor [Parabacteroides faecis]
MYNNSEQEKKLIAGLIHDDESAFCELYALYKNRLMYFAMKFLKSREFAEDVFQDAFTSVWQNRRFLNPDSPFAPYIYTIVKNRILNLLAGIEKEQQLKDIILKGSVDITNDTEDKIVDADLNQLLEKALQDLTSQQRRIFDLSRKEMKSHKEIAEELNISVYTVQQHISASLKVIRSYLVKYAGTYADLLLLLFCLNS